MDSSDFLKTKYPELEITFSISTSMAEVYICPLVNKYINNENTYNYDLDIKDILNVYVTSNIFVISPKIYIVDVGLNSIVYNRILDVNIVMTNSHVLNPIKLKNVTYHRASKRLLSQHFLSSFSDIQKDYMRNIRL